MAVAQWTVVGIGLVRYIEVQCSSEQYKDKMYAFFFNAMLYAGLYINDVTFMTIDFGIMKSLIKIYIPPKDLCEKISCNVTHIIYHNKS